MRAKAHKSVAPKIQFPEQSQADLGCPGRPVKYSLAFSENQNYKLHRLVPTRGAYRHRHDTWGAGCDGRSVSKANVLLRTAKSCGPGAAKLALSLAGSFFAR